MREAATIDLVDERIEANREDFAAAVEAMALSLAHRDSFATLLASKNERRAADEARKPLAAYGAEELARMHFDFFGFDPSYHVARYNFVHKVPRSRTPLHLALHRRSKNRSASPVACR